MKFESLHIIKCYSATLGIAAGAVLYAYFGIAPVFPGVLVFAAISYYSLSVACKAEEEDSPYQKISEFIAAIGIFAFVPLILLTDFLIAIVTFLGFAQLALNFQTFDYRRFYVGIVVSFIGICVGAAESKSGFYLVFFLTYTILASITIGYAYMVQRRHIESTQWDLTDRTRICLLMIGTAIIIYLILPRFPAGGLLSKPGSDHFYQNKKWEAEAKKNEKASAHNQINGLIKKKHDTQINGNLENHIEKKSARKSKQGQNVQQGDYSYKGFQTEFNINKPDDKGHRFSNRIVARMRADRPQYLRVRIFDLFDGLHWQTSSDQIIKLSVGYNGVDLISPEQNTFSELQTYELFIEYNLGNYIPAAAVPVKLNFPATAIGIDMFGQLYSPSALKEGTAYAVTSQYNKQQGRLFAELDHEPLPSYTQLPANTDPRIKEMAAGVSEGKASQLDIAIALEQHLRTQYQYDLESVFTSQNNTPLSEFLFETKNGHCEFFASALAVMLRTQNIPSRLITGFSATNKNPLTGYFDIYALDGHAWVEAYVDGQGWVILEPTAYYDGPVPKEQKLSVHQINEYVEHQVKLRNVLGQNELTLTTLINSVWQLLYMLFSAGLAYVKLFIINSWYVLIAILFIVIGSLFIWRQYGDLWMAYRIDRKVAAYTAHQPQMAVNFYLSAIEELLRLAGFRHPLGYTIEKYLMHIEVITSEPRNDTLSTVFNRIYYNSEQGEQEAIQDYKQLFRSLYSLGFRKLQSIAKTGCSKRIV